MTDLSPAAQAVLNAYENTYIDSGLIAAIFELADQLRLELPLGDTDADAGVFAAHQAIHAAILAIATELEGTNDPA
jgi:hypothetical protein